MKQRPCVLSVSFLSLTFVTTTQSTDLWFCLQKVLAILCSSGAKNALKVGGGSLGGCFLSGDLEGVAAIEVDLSGLQLLF